MDQIYRSFALNVQDNEGETFNYLQMTSTYSGEFGPVCLIIQADLDSRVLGFSSSFSQISAEDPGKLFYFRNNELSYFVLKILPLFNPLTSLNYGLSSSSPESQDL